MSNHHGSNANVIVKASNDIYNDYFAVGTSNGLYFVSMQLSCEMRHVFPGKEIFGLEYIGNEQIIVGTTISSFTRSLES